jgi:hypothetical protein
MYDDIRWRSKKKFMDEASQRHGFNKSEALKAYDKVDHDFKITRHDKEFLPIFARKPKSFQFDTLVQGNDNPYLIFINVNSRKAYAYRMTDKTADEVKLALKKHLRAVGSINELTSDEDPAYMSEEVQKWMAENNIITPLRSTIIIFLAF